MRVIYRYRTAKPLDGHFQFQLHADATIVSFAEHWHSGVGWEVFVDALEDTANQKERRNFFLCNAGDSLDFLGDNPDVFYLGTQSSKSYSSYLFDTTHLSETEREKGRIEKSRYVRLKPEWDDLSRTERERERAKAAARRAATAQNGVTSTAAPAAPGETEG